MSRVKLISHLLPKEHGAWAMWLVPFIIGVAAAGSTTLNTLLMFAACLLIFAARAALGSAIRLYRRERSVALKCAVSGMLEILLAAACSLPAILAGNVALLGLAVVVTILLSLDLRWINARAERNLFAEFAGVAGFALAAPTAIIATQGAWSAEAGVLWIVSFSYFAGSVFYVKMHVTRTARRETHETSGRFYARLTYLYVFLVVMMMIFLVTSNQLPGWSVFAFVPWILHLLWEAWQEKPLKAINKVGWSLVVHSLFFTLFVSFVLALH